MIYEDHLKRFNVSTPFTFIKVRKLLPFEHFSPTAHFSNTLVLLEGEKLPRIEYSVTEMHRHSYQFILKCLEVREDLFLRCCCINVYFIKKNQHQIQFLDYGRMSDDWILIFKWKFCLSYKEPEQKRNISFKSQQRVISHI